MDGLQLMPTKKKQPAKGRGTLRGIQKQLDDLMKLVGTLTRENETLKDQNCRLKAEVATQAPQEKIGKSKVGVRKGAVVMTEAESADGDRDSAAHAATNPSGFSPRLKGSVHVIDPGKPVQ